MHIAVACIWRSEVSLWELVLSFHHSGIKLRSLDLAAGVFPLKADLLALYEQFFYKIIIIKRRIEKPHMALHNFNPST